MTALALELAGPFLVLYLACWLFDLAYEGLRWFLRTTIRDAIRDSRRGRP